MKPTVATSLSVVAVLCAGVLAAAANLRVFAGPDGTGASAIGAAQPSAANAAIAPITDPRPDTVGPRTFSVGRAGSLTLDATGGLHVVGVDPAPGWRAERRAGPDGSVAVVFAPPSGPGVVVTATAGPGGIRVIAHEDATSGAEYEADRDADADDD